MYNRSFFAAALAGLLWVVPVSARADDQQATKSNKPAVVIRLASLDQLRGDFLYLAKLAGEEEKGKQIDALIKSQLDDKGLQGIGTKKPLAAYGWIGANGFDSQVVLLAPIVDQKAFLEMIENRLGTKPDKGKDEVYTLNVEKVPAPVYFRFANDYVYVTARDKDVLDKDKILPPSVVLPAGSNDTLSVTVDVAQIPNDIKNLALGAVENRLADLKEKEMPGHTEAQKKFHEAVVNEMGAHIKALFNHGGETTFRLNLNRKAGDFTLTLSVAGKPDTPLADSILELGKVKSLTAALQSGPSAFKAEFNLALPEKLRKTLEPALKDAEKQALSKAKNDGERQIVNTILNSVMPTLKAAELDTAFTLQGPNAEGIYTLVGGVKVKNGEQLEQTIRKTFAHDETVKLDIDKAGEVSIHRVSPKNVDAGIRRAMGDNPMYVAIRGDAAFIALGDKGLEAVKKAAAVAPTTGKVIELQMALARLAPLMHDKAALAKKVFGDDKDTDQFVLTLEGGKALTLRLSAKAKLLDFLIRMKKEEGH